jgi:hypothetical protein
MTKIDKSYFQWRGWRKIETTTGDVAQYLMGGGEEEKNKNKNKNKKSVMYLTERLQYQKV